MQKNNITEDFDLFVKGSLQEAEETPSPRVWQAIESRLDAATAPAAASFRWGWYVAAAAAAVAAFLVIPNNSNLSTISSREHQALAQASSIELAAIPSPREISAPARRNASTFVLGSTDEAKQQAAEPQQSSEKTQAAEQSYAQNVAEQKSTSEQSVSNSQRDRSKGQVATEPQVDPFAAMTYEDGKTARRKIGTALYLGGTMGGNESSSGGAAYGAKSTNSGYIENVITETSASNYGIPVSLGAGAKFNLGGNLSASVGADFSYLSRSFNGTYSPAGEIPTAGEILHEMHYIGIPVGIYYNILNSGSVNFYLLGLGEAEWCLSNEYTMRASGVNVSEKVSGTQFSAGGGFGVSFNLSKLLSIYVDPTVRYYFDCGQPNSIRSEKQLMLNFNAGLRFNL